MRVRRGALDQLWESLARAKMRAEDDMAKRGWTRRGAIAAATSAVAACAQNIETPAYEGPVAFNHGVASGDPQPNKVIIWTRVSPQNPGAVPVRWIVARNRELSDVVKTGVFETNEGRDYTVKVELVAGADGKRLAETQDGCEICGVVDASGLIDSAAATLRLKLDALSKGPASVKMTSNPQGAIVTVDGEVVGETPIERPVVPGKHLIRVSEEGYISIEREVTFVEGVNEDLNFSLEKLPSRLPGRRFGYVSLGFGLAAIGGAIGFAILDDKPYKLGGKCSTSYAGDPDGDFNQIPGDNSITGRDECANLWRTEPFSIPLAIAGGALLTLGIVILVNSRQKTKKDGAAVTARRSSPRNLPRFGIGPGSVSLSGRF